MSFRKIKTTSTHTVFNVGLSGFDIFTDIRFAIQLFILGHFKWGALTLTFVFTPFLIKLCELAWDSWKKGKVPEKKQWLKVFLHLPLLAPFVNLLLAVRLLLLDFDSPEQASKIEEILKAAGLTSLYESFCEAGPQLVLQTHIVACTGQFSRQQQVTSIISLISLTWSSSRAFFILRDSNYADADPNLKMVCLVIPLMLCQVISSTFCLTMVGGILKEWIILIVAVASLLNFCLLLRGFKKRPGNTSDVEKGNNVELRELLELPKDKGTESQPREGEQETEKTTVSFFMMCFLLAKCCFRICLISACHCCCCCCCLMRVKISRMDGPSEYESCCRYWKRVRDEIEKELHKLRKPLLTLSESLVNSLREPVEREEERFFRLKSVVTSTWVPCVVGEKQQNTTSMFLRSGLTSTITKHIGVLIAIMVYNFNVYFPASLQYKSILFFCQNPTTVDLNATNTCQGWNDCFKCTGECDLQQKIRLCGNDNEEEFLWRMFTIIFCLSFCLSVVIVIFLNELSDYKLIYDLTSKLCCCCFPVAHRSLIFDYIKTKEIKKLCKVLNFTTAEDIMRQNSEGVSPIHLLVKSGNDGFLLKVWETLSGDKKKLYSFNTVDGSNKTPFEFAIDCGAKTGEKFLISTAILSWPQKDFKHEGQTFANCSFLHRLIILGHGEEVLERKEELSSELLSSTCTWLRDTGDKITVEVFPTDPSTQEVTSLHLIAAFIKDRRVGEALVQLYLSNIDAGHLSDINVQDDGQRTPLHYAVQCNNVDVVELLINISGADVRAIDTNKQTPLHFAARHNPSADVIRALVEGGAVVDARADYGLYKQLTPLHFAVRHNPSADVIRALVDKGADIDARDYMQWTPLHWAALSNPGKVEILIAKGANVNVLDIGQWSPLYRAARDNKREAVIELCKAGANPQLGDNPLDDNNGVADEMKQLIRENCLSLYSSSSSFLVADEMK